MDIYMEVPELSNDNFLIRKLEEKDLEDLFLVYSDKNSVPFFNSDNCHGDTFYYDTMDKMTKAIAFWTKAYRKHWFMRWSIVDKNTNKVIGTIEEFKRSFNDLFDNCALIRLDIKSEYENEDAIFSIMDLITAPSFTYFDCERIITKGFKESIERVKALERLGYKEKKEPMIGSDDGISYYHYYEIDLKK